MTPVFKKDSRNDVTNYRPVSVLSNLSKVYEKCMFNETTGYIDDILSKYKCGFRKREEGASFGALLPHLSKAFDCLLHDLLIAKLHAYGFDMPSLKLQVTENKEFRLITISVHGKKSHLVFRKDPRTVTF